VTFLILIWPLFVAWIHLLFRRGFKILNPKIMRMKTKIIVQNQMMIMILITRMMTLFQLVQKNIKGREPEKTEMSRLRNLQHLRCHPHLIQTRMRMTKMFWFLEIKRKLSVFRNHKKLFFFSDILPLTIQKWCLFFIKISFFRSIFIYFSYLENFHTPFKYIYS
jgi:hypothetical protein